MSIRANLIPAATRLGLVALGASAGPAVGLAALGVGSFVASIVSEEALTKLLGDELGKRVASTLGNFLAEFGADGLRGLVTELRSDLGRNFDIERALAAAIREALGQIKPDHPGEKQSFEDWLLYLNKPDDQKLQRMFVTGNANDVILLAERPDAWWPHLEATLRRWLAEHRSHVPAMLLDDVELPRIHEPLLSDLKSRLPKLAEHEFHQQITNRPEAWVAFQRQFLQLIASRQTAQHADLSMECCAFSRDSVMAATLRRRS